MLKFIFWSIVIYALIRFIFNFVIPLVRTAGQMKKQVREFQEKMNTENQFSGTGQSSANIPPKRPAPKPKAEDYIDFEEIK